MSYHNHDYAEPKLGQVSVSNNSKSISYTETPTSTSLLQDNLENYMGQVNYLEDLISRLEGIGHKLHDTNVPSDVNNKPEPPLNTGKLFDMQETNYRFRKQNERFDNILSKLNSLI